MHNSYRCPCCRQNAKWRKQDGLDKLIDEDIVCDKFKACVPLGLMSHLRKMGGVYSEKVNRKLEQVPMKCKFHYGARMFLEYLYKDYHGGESTYLWQMMIISISRS